MIRKIINRNTESSICVFAFIVLATIPGFLMLGAYLGGLVVNWIN